MTQTVASALRDAAERLGAVSDSARLDAEWLMAHALGTGRSAMLLSRGGDRVPDVFAALVERRTAGEPLAHIIGEQEFYGLPLTVTPDVLIPRGDSETLIDAARDMLGPRSPSRVLDCGTGSGALLLAALSVWPEAHGIGIERSPAALAVARENAKLCDMAARCEMRGGDWDAPSWADDLGRFDLILANPPYIEDADPDLADDVRSYEPAGALFAGPDGLAAYRTLLPQIPALLSPGGIAVFEIGSRQADMVAAIAAVAGFASRLYHDLSDHPRALALWMTGKSTG